MQSRIRFHGVCFALATITTIIILITPQLILAENAAPIKDEACLECHDGLNKSLEAGPHRLGSEYAQPKIVVACVSCHAGAQAHLDNPARETITTPAELTGHEAFQTCTQCHLAHIGLDNYGFDVHAEQEMNCSQCHKIHVYDRPLLLDDQAAYCQTCHQETKTGFGRVSNHPVKQGNLTCLSCHRFLKRQDARLEYDLAGICRTCHPSEAGPFPYEHEAMNGYSVEEGGCTECHSPHGSANDRLLLEPGNQLCRRCHTPTGHTTAHGGIWASYDCRTCHTDTHGSFVSSRFLDPGMAAKLGGDCFNTGCHALNR